MCLTEQHYKERGMHVFLHGVSCMRVPYMYVFAMKKKMQSVCITCVKMTWRDFDNCHNDLSEFHSIQTSVLW